MGVPPTTEALIEVLFDLPGELVVRPGTRILIADAEAGGFPVGVLTNDLHDFHGTAWFHDLEVFERAPAALVDGSLTGHLEPAPPPTGSRSPRWGVHLGSSSTSTTNPST